MTIQELISVNTKASNFYHKNYVDEVTSYFIDDRKLTAPIVRKFKLGYGGKDDDLFNSFRKEGVEETTLIDLNLRSKTELYSYDTFFERHIFPIWNEVGDIVGFGGRSTNDYSAKYTNTADTRLFAKNKIIYGMNFALSHILQKGFVYLVEGYMDVIRMHQEGFLNTVASMGTSLTLNQVHLLNQYTNKVIIIYDNDEAGKIAALRAIERLAFRDLLTELIIVPKKNKDIDKHLEINGGEALYELNKVDKMDYLAITITDKKEREKWIKKWSVNCITNLV